MNRMVLAFLLLGLFSCATEEEKSRSLIVNEIKSNLSNPDSFELIRMDTLDCYKDLRHCILRVTFKHKPNTTQSIMDLSFVALSEDFLMIESSEDIREMGDYVKLSTYHLYAKKIDFGSKHLIGDFDILSVEELKKIDLESRGLTK